jgi:RNA polymerase sigma-70 factor (ECF subfamily)
MGEKQSRFEELLLPHLDGAYNLARWLVEKDQDAQAVVREAYTQALKEFAESREADARTWLLTIVRKTAYHWIQRGHHSRMIPFEETILEGPTNKPLPAVSDQERRRSLYEALSKLPVELREVLVLHDIEGWTYTQLASALEAPHATVLHRLRMARRSLRQELAETHGRGSSDAV